MMQNLKGLFLGIAVIRFFMFGLAPWMEGLPLIRPVVAAIIEREIDASALYYTEIEEFSDAAVYLSNTMDYPPKGP